MSRKRGGDTGPQCGREHRRAAPSRSSVGPRPNPWPRTLAARHGSDRTDQELALATDVEQAGASRNGDRQRRQEIRGQPHQHVAEGVGVPGDRVPTWPGRPRRDRCRWRPAAAHTRRRGRERRPGRSASAGPGRSATTSANERRLEAAWSITPPPPTSAVRAVVDPSLRRRPRPPPLRRGARRSGRTPRAARRGPRRSSTRRRRTTQRSRTIDSPVRTVRCRDPGSGRRAPATSGRGEGPGVEHPLDVAAGQGGHRSVEIGHRQRLEFVELRGPRRHGTPVDAQDRVGRSRPRLKVWSTLMPGTTPSAIGSSGMPTAPAAECGPGVRCDGPCAVDVDLAVTNRAQTEDRLVELSLAATGHAGDSDPFPASPRRGRRPAARDRRDRRATSTLRIWRAASPARAAPGAPASGRTVCPTIASTSSSSSSSSGAIPSTIIFPPRSTVSRSAFARASRSLWVIRTTARPRRRSSSTVAKRASTSWGASALVGSSRMTTRAPTISTRRISTC